MEVNEMRDKIYITNAIYENSKELRLQVDSGIVLKDLKPTGQMLVDSDHFSFIYLVEKDNEYIYIVSKDEVWSEFRKAIEADVPVYLTNGTERFELSGFLEELSYLIENIKGNSNYGEEMVAKVEETF